MIDILLSTYNGEKYLAEQLQSILSQTYTDWKLTVRDDGSSDGTLRIIGDFARRHPEKVRLLNDSLGNLGCTRSFERLLECSTSDYVMFSDQDDVWLPTKIERTLQEMLAEEKKRDVVVVFTDAYVVDENLTDKNISYFEMRNLSFPRAARFHYVCASNPAAGCTMMLNRRAVENVLPFGASAPVHDWWVAAKAAKEDGLVAIRECTMKYRQHEKNVYGVQGMNMEHYVDRLLHLHSMVREFSYMKPFLQEVGFGGMGKFWRYKIMNFFLRSFGK